MRTNTAPLREGQRQLALTLNRSGSQRWQQRREKLLPNESRINPAEFGVDYIGHGQAEAFCREHHYSGSMGVRKASYGLFRRTGVGASRLVGVCVFTIPIRNEVPLRYTGLPIASCPELGRLVLLDEVLANGESWFVSRALKALRRDHPEIKAVVSFSDPVERRLPDGTLLKPGHYGIVYQSLGAVFAGRSSRRKLWMRRDGTNFSPRTLDKIPSQDRGCKAAEQELLDWGAPPRSAGECPREWLQRALRDGPFVPRIHPGNFAYAWGLDKQTKARLAAMHSPSKPYPKPYDAKPEPALLVA